MDIDDEDIYGDLPLFDVNKECERLQEEVKQLQLKLDEFAVKVDELTAAKEELIKRNRVLQKNISILMKTAKQELQRKDAVILELRNELKMQNAGSARPLHAETNPVDVTEFVCDTKKTVTDKVVNKFTKSHVNKGEPRGDLKERLSKLATSSVNPGDRKRTNSDGRPTSCWSDEDGPSKFKRRRYEDELYPSKRRGGYHRSPPRHRGRGYNDRRSRTRSPRGGRHRTEKRSRTKSSSPERKEYGGEKRSNENGRYRKEKRSRTKSSSPERGQYGGEKPSDDRGRHNTETTKSRSPDRRQHASETPIDKPVETNLRVEEVSKRENCHEKPVRPGQVLNLLVPEKPTNEPQKALREELVSPNEEAKNQGRPDGPMTPTEVEAYHSSIDEPEKEDGEMSDDSIDFKDAHEFPATTRQEQQKPTNVRPHHHPEPSNQPEHHQKTTTDIRPQHQKPTDLRCHQQMPTDLDPQQPNATNLKSHQLEPTDLRHHLQQKTTIKPHQRPKNFRPEQQQQPAFKTLFTSRMEKKLMKEKEEEKNTAEPEPCQEKEEPVPAVQTPQKAQTEDFEDGEINSPVQVDPPPENVEPQVQPEKLLDRRLSDGKEIPQNLKLLMPNQPQSMVVTYSPFKDSYKLIELSPIVQKSSKRLRNPGNGDSAPSGPCPPVSVFTIDTAERREPAPSGPIPSVSAFTIDKPERCDSPPSGPPPPISVFTSDPAPSRPPPSVSVFTVDKPERPLNMADILNKKSEDKTVAKPLDMSRYRIPKKNAKKVEIETAKPAEKAPSPKKMPGLVELHKEEHPQTQTASSNLTSPKEQKPGGEKIEKQVEKIKAKWEGKKTKTLAEKTAKETKKPAAEKVSKKKEDIESTEVKKKIVSSEPDTKKKNTEKKNEKVTPSAAKSKEKKETKTIENEKAESSSENKKKVEKTVPKIMESDKLESTSDNTKKAVKTVVSVSKKNEKVSATTKSKDAKTTENEKQESSSDNTKNNVATVSKKSAKAATNSKDVKTIENDKPESTSDNTKKTVASVSKKSEKASSSTNSKDTKTVENVKPESSSDNAKKTVASASKKTPKTVVTQADPKEEKRKTDVENQKSKEEPKKENQSTALTIATKATKILVNSSDMASSHQGSLFSDSMVSSSPALNLKNESVIASSPSLMSDSRLNSTPRTDVDVAKNSSNGTAEKSLQDSRLEKEESRKDDSTWRIENSENCDIANFKIFKSINMSSSPSSLEKSGENLSSTRLHTDLQLSDSAHEGSETSNAGSDSGASDVLDDLF